MLKRTNYYKELLADYSRSGLVAEKLKEQLIEKAEKIVAMKEDILPAITDDYNLDKIEQENKEWWPTHCEALSQGRGDILTGEYRDDLVYFCQDGPYQGLEQQKARELHWWALIAQPGVTMRGRRRKRAVVGSALLPLAHREAALCGTWQTMDLSKGTRRTPILRC